ncbi:hypothetical protein PFISCL1PPCAC_4977, partial [Pristionchus fissidentatus]
MSVMNAWLILISGVSLLHYSMGAEILELDDKTCRGPDSSDEANKLRLPCFTGCLTTGEWRIESDKTQLNTCDSLVAIRKYSDSKWLIVMQLKGGSDADHDNGIQIRIVDSSSETLMIKCHRDEGRAKTKSEKDYKITEIRGRIGTSFTLCEAIVERRSGMLPTSTAEVTLKIGVNVKKKNSLSDMEAMLKKTLTCKELNVDVSSSTIADNELYLPVFSWNGEVKCIAPGKDKNDYGKHFKLKAVKPTTTGLVQIVGIECKHYGGTLFKYEVKWSADTQMKAYDEPLTAMCVAQACSFCENQADCTHGGDCPEFKEPDPDGSCADLTCKDNKRIYMMKGDAKTTAQGEPKCVRKSTTHLFDLHKGLDEQVQWEFNGAKIDRLRCAKAVDCPIAPIRANIAKNSEDPMKVLETRVFCTKNTTMRYKNGNDHVEIERLNCNGATGKWEEVPLEKNKKADGEATAVTTFDPNLNRTLECYKEGGDSSVSSGQTSMIAVGGAVGTVALILIAVLICFCCGWACFKKKKKETATNKTSNTAVSSDQKRDEPSLVTAIPQQPTPVSAPMVIVPITVEKKQQPVSESTIKKEKKDEFLKFDDSNMSEVQGTTRKDGTERVDLIQQEESKMTNDQKKEEKKKREDLYPKLADIDDDWKDDKDDNKEAKSKDKTTLASKATLNTKQLQNPPHDDGQYEALGMPTVLGERTAIDEKTNKEEGDESGASSKKSTTQKKKTAMQLDKSKLTTRLETALDAKLLDMEKTAILNEEEGETQAATNKTTSLLTGRGKTLGTEGTQTRGATTLEKTQGRTTYGATTQRTRTNTAATARTITRGDPTQANTFISEGVTARDPTANDETQMPTDTRNDPTQATDGRTAREVTANDMTQGTDGFTAKELTPSELTQAITEGRTARGLTPNDLTQMTTDARTGRDLTAADFTQNGKTRTLTGRTAISRTREGETQLMSADGRTALTKTRATRTQDQTTRTADQETQEPTMMGDPTQITPKTRTSRTQETRTGYYDPTQDATTLNDQTQAITEGRTGITKTRASRTQMTRTGTTQDQTAFDPTQDPTMFDQTQITAGGRTRTIRTQGATMTGATQADMTRTGRTQDQTTIGDQTQMITEGRTGMTRTRASRTQDFTQTGATQDQTAFDPTQDQTAFDQTQMTAGGRTRTSRTQGGTTMTGMTQMDPTRTGITQDQTTIGDQTQMMTEGRTAITRTRAGTTQDPTRDPTRTQEATTVGDATQMVTDGRTGVTRTRVTRTQDVTMTKDRTQDPTTAFDQTQVNSEGRTAMSRTKATRTQDTRTRGGDPTQDPTTAFDQTQMTTEGRTAVSRTKGRTTQGETLANDFTQAQTEGNTAISRTKARTTQGGTTADDGTQAQTEGRTAVSRTKGRTTQGETTANDGTQVQTEGRTAVSRTKGRTTQDGTTANDGTQVQTDGNTAVSRTKGRTTQVCSEKYGTTVSINMVKRRLTTVLKPRRRVIRLYRELREGPPRVRRRLMMEHSNRPKEERASREPREEPLRMVRRRTMAPRYRPMQERASPEPREEPLRMVRRPTMEHNNRPMQERAS